MRFTKPLPILQELRAKLDLLSVPNDVWKIEHVGHDTQAVCRCGQSVLIAGKDTLSLIRYPFRLSMEEKQAVHEVFGDMKPLCMEMPSKSMGIVTVFRLERR